MARLEDLARDDTVFFNINICRNNIDDVYALTEIIRVDGTLAPCFPMYSAKHDWGAVGAPAFDRAQLDEMKVTWEPNCYSTLNHIVGWCCNDGRVIRWLAKQASTASRGFGATCDRSCLHRLEACGTLRRRCRRRRALARRPACSSSP